jgi:hypothetical protein
VKLFRLSGEASHLVTRELASGALPRHHQATYEAYLEEPEAPVDLAAFDAAVEAVLEGSRPLDSGLDRRAAPALHRALPLSRREASHPGVWRFLATVHCPQLVRHRWGDASLTTTKARYWNFGTRPDSNAICRWWWIAELTQQAGSYLLTEATFERQPLATQLFVRGFSRYRPSVAAFLRVMKDEPSEEIERVAKELYGRLSTLVLEAMSEDDLVALLKNIAAGSQT